MWPESCFNLLSRPSLMWRIKSTRLFETIDVMFIERGCVSRRQTLSYIARLNLYKYIKETKPAFKELNATLKMNPLILQKRI